MTIVATQQPRLPEKKTTTLPQPWLPVDLANDPDPGEGDSRMEVLL